MADAWPTYLLSLQKALLIVERVSFEIHRHVKSVRDLSEQGDVARTRFDALVAALDAAGQQFALAASRPGIAAFVQAQYDLPGFDAVASFQAMNSARQSLRDWMQTRLDNNPDMTSFTSAQTAGFRAAADAFLATINVTGP